MPYPSASDLFTVVCRPALPKDTQDVMALIHRIWDGHDYVQSVWQQWLSDPNGRLVVAEYGGRVVGLVKVSWLGEDDWWLQGLRVDPDFQGQGIASHLHDYALDFWERHAGGVMRLATSSARLPVHHLCERTGFKKVGDYRSYSAIVPAAGSVDPVRALVPLTEDVVDEAMSLAASTSLYMLTSGLFDLAWEWVSASAPRLAQAAQNKRAYWFEAPDGMRRGLLVVGTDEDDDYGGEYLFIQMMSGLLEDVPDILREFRCLASQMGLRRIVWVVPVHEAILAALEGAGFKVDWDHSIYVFEKRLDSRVESSS